MCIFHTEEGLARGSNITDKEHIVFVGFFCYFFISLDGAYQREEGEAIELVFLEGSAFRCDHNLRRSLLRLLWFQFPGAHSG